MPTTLTAWTERDAVRDLLREPSLAREFDAFAGDGLERLFADPFCTPETRLLLLEDGVLAAFAFAFVLPSGGHGPWAMIRVGVGEAYRRRGHGSLLVRELTERIRRLAPDASELCMTAWEPCAETEPFARAHGYAMVRRYWLMERPANGLSEPEWPPGITPVTYARNGPALEDYTRAYNEAFAAHFHFVPATLEAMRPYLERPGLDPANVLLAYEGNRCAGFCRCERFDERGEVALLGVIPEARGRGLGRALLRWGGRRLLEIGAVPITLLVDGENESALRLYRDEGYDVVRTRRTWARALAR